MHAAPSSLPITSTRIVMSYHNYYCTVLIDCRLVAALTAVLSLVYRTTTCSRVAAVEASKRSPTASPRDTLSASVRPATTSIAYRSCWWATSVRAAPLLRAWIIPTTHLFTTSTLAKRLVDWFLVCRQAGGQVVWLVLWLVGWLV